MVRSVTDIVLNVLEKSRKALYTVQSTPFMYAQEFSYAI